MRKRKSQAANEFLILVGILIFASVLFLGSIRNYADEAATNKEENAISDYGKFLQNEFITASKVKSGYVRELQLPSKIQGYDYSVANSNDSITLISHRSDMEFFYEIPGVNGSLQKGYNKIVKKGGVVQIK